MEIKKYVKGEKDKIKKKERKQKKRLEKIWQI